MIGDWTTPSGHAATMEFREGTNDWNVLSSVNRPGNEYDLPTGLAGWALDIGAHLGGVSIALALDNPELRVLAVEPQPDNLRLLHLNIGYNSLTDRITVVDGVAGTDPLVTYGGHGQSAEHHAFIGNNEWSLVASGSETISARCYSLSGLMRRIRAQSIAFMKIDCEGCEWSFLADPAIGKVSRISGEWHPPGIAERLSKLLDPTHVVTFIGDHGFAAVLRA